MYRRIPDLERSNAPAVPVCRWPAATPHPEYQKDCCVLLTEKTCIALISSSVALFVSSAMPYLDHSPGS
eukprot:6537191-Pyramimonas_sp.AAC.1